MNGDEFVAAVSPMVEEHFPKGQCKERGQAIVLVAEITRMLIEKGLIKE